MNIQRLTALTGALTIGLTAAVAPPTVVSLKTVTEIDAYRKTITGKGKLVIDELAQKPKPTEPQSGCDGGETHLQAWSAERSSSPQITHLSMGSWSDCGDGEWGMNQIYYQGTLVYADFTYPPYARDEGLEFVSAWFNSSGQLIQLLNGPIPVELGRTPEDLTKWIRTGCDAGYCSAHP